MKVEQISTIVKDVYKQVVGSENIDTLDTMTIVDMGKAILDSTDTENYLKSLTDVIGKTIFTDRKYQGNAPSVLMEKWDFGSVLRKIDVDLQDTDTVNSGSYPLTHGTSVSQDTVYLPSATVKLFNKKVTFEIDVTIAEQQAKSAFNSVNDLNTFISMIYNAVEKSMTVYIDNLIMSTINNMTAQTLNSVFPSVTDNDYSGMSNIKAVNLLYDYNTAFGTSLTVADSLTDKDFLKYATSTINKYSDRMGKMSTLFNVGGKARFTPREQLNIIMLSDFKSNCASYLEADTVNNELVSLPLAESVPYWQGSGTSYAFDSVSKIDVNIGTGANNATAKNISCSGILAVMFDRVAIGVCNDDRRVTTHYNAKGEFFNNFYKFECSYFNDMNENFVMFYVA